KNVVSFCQANLLLRVLPVYVVLIRHVKVQAIHYSDTVSTFPVDIFLRGIIQSDNYFFTVGSTASLFCYMFFEQFVCNKTFCA
ncbi:MAG: hypothetical protein P8107_15115, partial [Spirochaetia bacterium]